MAKTYAQCKAEVEATHPEFRVQEGTTVTVITPASDPATYDAMAAERAQWCVEASVAHDEQTITKTLGDQIQAHVHNMEAARDKLQVDDADRQAVNTGPRWDAATGNQRSEMLRVSLDEGLLSLGALIKYLVRKGVIDPSEEAL